MKKTLFKYLFLSLFFINYSTTANITMADIIETNSLEPFEATARAANKDTLVIFDVQEVLMVAKDQILNPLYKVDYRAIKDRIIATYSLEQQELLFSTILKQYETEIVDPALIKTLEALKAKGVRTIALTSGYTGKYGIIENREDLRLQRLKNIGIDFKDSFPNVAPLIFLDLKGADPKHSPMFKDGVIFACRLSKGEVLRAFLQKVKYTPKRIIFVDNQLKNIKTVESYCEDEGIEYIGFHYNFIRNKTKIILNESVVEHQFTALEKHHKWLSDKEALLQLSKK